MNQGFIGISLAIGLVIVLIGGISYWVWSQKSDQRSSIQNPALFKNDKYSIEVQYPNVWRKEIREESAGTKNILFVRSLTDNETWISVSHNPWLQEQFPTLGELQSELDTVARSSNREFQVRHPQYAPEGGYSLYEVNKVSVAYLDRVIALHVEVANNLGDGITYTMYVFNSNNELLQIESSKDFSDPAIKPIIDSIKLTAPL